jgi:glutaredoxin
MKPRVTLYTRAGCCLCEDAKRVIAEARLRADFDYEEVDIDRAGAGDGEREGELRRLYNDEVPVIAINGAKAFKYRVGMSELLKKLAARA